MTYMQEIFYKIGEVSDLLGIEQHTLRYLENTLKLKIKRDERGDRLYTESDLETLRLILTLKNEKGLNTTAIKLALENMEQTEETALRPKSVSTSINLSEMAGIAKRIVEQNDELLQQNKDLHKRIDELERKIDKKEQERQSRIDELIKLWKKEQEGNKSWLAKLRGK